MRFIKTLQGLQPFDRDAADWFRGLTAEPVLLQPIDEEETHYRGYVFACIHEVAEAIDTSAEQLRAELLLETGRFRKVGDVFGKSVVAIDSMSRAHMSDAQLRAFWDEASDVIRFKILARVGDLDERERLHHRLQKKEEAT